MRTTTNRRRRIATAWVSAAIATLALGLAPAAASAEDGGGAVYRSNYGDMVAEWNGCAFVFSTGTIGGISTTGWSSAWVIKSDPARSRDDASTGDLPACDFQGSLSLAYKAQQPGAPDHSIQFSGNNSDVSTQQTQIVSRDDEMGIRPKTFTIFLCRDGACSGPREGAA